jgi:hypothetical protein
VRADELRERQARALRLHVPQRDVEGRQRLDREAASADRRTGPQQLRVDLLDVARILAEEIRRDFLRVRVDAGTARAFRVRKAHALEAITRADLGEDEGNFRERLLPSREHLRIAHRLLEGQDRVRNLDAVDAIGHLARRGTGHLVHGLDCLTTKEKSLT